MQRSVSATQSYGTVESRLLGELPSAGRPNAQRFLCWLFRIVSVFFLVYFLIIFWISMMFTCYGPLNPPYPSGNNWKNFMNQSIGVGFDLSASYGTAAVRFANGTVVNVGRADGTDEYNRVLERFAVKSNSHTTPPYYNCDHQFRDLGRQWHRYMRKTLGLPASSDVAALAHVLGSLKEQTNTFLNPTDSVEVALILVPYLPSFWVQDLVDAAEYSKFQMLTLPWYIYKSGDAAQWPVTEINGAMAGNGFGMQYEDPIHHPPNQTTPLVSDNVFSVLFTNTVLTAHVGPFLSALHFYAADGIANFSLGLNSHPDSSDPTGQENYWTAIRLSLRTALDSYLNRGHELGLVIAHGEAAHNPTFTAILRDETLNAQDRGRRNASETLIFSSVDPVYAGARGAAEFAWLCRRGFGVDPRGECFPDLRPKMQGW